MLAGSIEEVDHLLQVLGTVHTHAMTTLRHKSCLGLDTGSLQQFVEFLTLAARYYIILLTMENNDWRTILVDIAGSTQAKILVWFLTELRVQQHIFR